MHDTTTDAGRIAVVRIAHVRAGSSVAGPTVDVLRQLVAEADRNGVDGRTTVHITHSPSEAVSVLHAVDVEPVNPVDAPIPYALDDPPTPDRPDQV